MRRQLSAGFTYVGLMILVAMIGLVAAATLKAGSLFQRAAKEKELLEIGAQFSEALRSYAKATPAGSPTQPMSLKELLRDPRFPNPRRHLRKIFVDPITGKAEWGVVYLRDKAGVLAVYSLSDSAPLKIANFDLRFQNMEGKERISDWKFAMAGGDALNPSLLAPNSMGGAPSLFAPGAAGSAAGGEAPKPPPPPPPVTVPPPTANPGAPASPAPGAEETSTNAPKADEPKAEEPPAEEAPADAPQEPAAEEARDTEKDEDADATPPAGTVKGPSTIVTPPPGHRRSR